MKFQYKNCIIDIFFTKVFSFHYWNEWKKYDKCISIGLGFIRFEITKLFYNPYK
jgi:hypothetical protein